MKHKLLIEFPPGQRPTPWKLGKVIPMRHSFRLTATTYGVWFDSDDEREAAKQIATEHFPDATLNQPDAQARESTNGINTNTNGENETDEQS